MNQNLFRQRLLKVISELQVQTPDMQLHLLYAPELYDPLALAQDDRRSSALLRRPFMAQLPEASTARVITLDCRRIASYLLETHHGIDDPLLESSITQAYAEIYLGEGIQSAVTNDDSGMAESAICGWIISRDTAQQIASRINGMAKPRGASYPQELVRWYCPDAVSALWPTLTPAQRRALLGDSVWLLHDASGAIHSYAAEGVSHSDHAEDVRQVHRLSEQQWRRIDNMPVVKLLAERWTVMCNKEGLPVPPDSHAQLHRLVLAAQEHHLDAENLMLYVMTAVQLPVDALQSPEFRDVLDQVSLVGLPLREGLKRLPDQFWERYEPRAKPSAPLLT